MNEWPGKQPRRRYVYTTMRSISAIIPAYEDALRLRHTVSRLRAIREREYPLLEIIVSVRESRDGTLDVARGLADVVVTTEGFVSESRNTGAALAKGEVLLFLDSDAVPSFGTIPRIAAAAEEGTIGTCTSYPNRFGWRAFAATALQNMLKASHLVKGSSLMFCHRSIFFDDGVRYDPALNIGEHHDFVRRALKRGARHVYLRIPRGYRVDVRRYERFGYLHTFVFWFLFSAYSVFSDRALAEEFARIYWDTRGRVSYRSITRPLLCEFASKLHKAAAMEGRAFRNVFASRRSRD